MNIALGALIIVLLLLPALTFRLGITSSRFKKSKAQVPQVSPSTSPSMIKEQENHEYLHKFSGIITTLNFSDTLFFFSIVPITLHFISLLLLHFVVSWLGYEINFMLLLDVLIGKTNIDVPNTRFSGELLQFLFYSILQMILAYYAAIFLLSRKGIIKRIIKLLGRENPWYRLFIEPFKNDATNAKISLITLDILVNTKETTMIYTGYMKGFYFKAGTREIDFITIYQPMRRDLRKEYRTEGAEPTKNQFYTSAYGEQIDIASTYLMIPGKEILNVNALYWGTKVNANNNEEYYLITTDEP